MTLPKRCELGLLGRGGPPVLIQNGFKMDKKWILRNGQPMVLKRAQQVPDIPKLKWIKNVNKMETVCKLYGDIKMEIK